MTRPSTTAFDRRLGTRIRVLRLAARMSQSDLGQALGVTFQQVQKYEKGTNRVSASRLSQLAVALRVPLASLLEADAALDDVELAAAFGTPEGVRLALAFQRIRDPALRQAIVTLVQAAGGAETPRAQDQPT